MASGTGNIRQDMPPVLVGGLCSFHDERLIVCKENTSMISMAGVGG